MATKQRVGKRTKKRGDELTEIIVVRVSPNILAELQERADLATVPVGTVARQQIILGLATKAAA